VDWQLRKVEAQSFLNAVKNEWNDGQPTPETILLEGRAASRIIEYIEENDPDLVMFSSHGNTGISSWNLGSIAQKIISGASRSFMLLPAYQANQPVEEGVEKARYRRILVPLDGSKRAEFVLPVASRLSTENDAEILLVHAVSPPQLIQSHALKPEEKNALEMINRHNEVEADHYLAKTADQWGARVKTQRISGSNTVDALLDFVKTEDIDLVVMAAHGRSGETNRPYGSVVSSFIAYGSTPLLIIQDFTQDQINPTRVELNAVDNGSMLGRMNRTLTYAQPATWYHRR
jgi:nucleotide-binding universal stress UspA family protein